MNREVHLFVKRQTYVPISLTIARSFVGVYVWFYMCSLTYRMCYCVAPLIMIADFSFQL